MNRKALLLITIFAEGGLFVIGLILMRFSQLEWRPGIEISWRATIYALLFCLPMLAALAFALRTRWTPLSRLRNELYEKVVPILARTTLPDLALIAFFAGIGEELFFRGWLQSLLAYALGTWTGIVLASIFFGLTHYLSITYAIYAALIGLYLGVIYQLTGNLYIVMFIHAFYDFVALVYLTARERNKRIDDIDGNIRERGDTDVRTS